MKNKFCCVSLVLTVFLMWVAGMAAALEHSDAHGGASAASGAGGARLQAAWMWNVLVIPPKGGWAMSFTNQRIASQRPLRRLTQFTMLLKCQTILFRK